MKPDERVVADAVFFVLALLVGVFGLGVLIGSMVGHYFGAAGRLETAQQLETCETRARLEHHQTGGTL